MKTFRETWTKVFTSLSGFAALFLTVGAFAADITVPSDTITNGVPASIPVGNETFFRTNGMRIVRFVHVDLWDGNGQIGIGWTYPYPGAVINEKGDWTEAQLLALGKESITTHLKTFGSDTFQERPESGYYLEVVWGTREESLFGYGHPFRYEASFKPVQVDGQWQAPASIVDSMRMEFGEYVFATLSDTAKVRLRWFEGGKFNDYSYPGESITLQSVKPSSQTTDTTFALPTSPMLKKHLGILTRVFTDGSIVRYFTSNGTLLPGEQKEREPTILAIQYRPADKWSKAGIIFDFSWDRDWDPTGESIALEMSTDFTTWIPWKYFELETVPAMFYRARYIR